MPPRLTVLTAARRTASGFILLTPSAGAGYQGGLMLADNSGDPVWFLPLPTGGTNLRVQTYRGQPALTWWQGEIILPGYGKGSYFIADSSYKVVKEVHGGNGLMGDLHEFVLTRDGTALFTAYDDTPKDLSSVGGPKNGHLLDSLLQEVDLSSGKVLFEWRASDHVGLRESYASAPTKSSETWDFFHINSIDVDTDGDLLVSGRHTWCVYKINRRTGNVIWRLNGKKSDFTMGPRTKFSWQHSARHDGDNFVTIFDDGAGLYNVERQSRGLKLSLDLKQKKAKLRDQYLPDPRVLATSQGSVQVLPDGNVFVGWGSQPYFSEYSAEGKLLFDAALPAKSHSYRAFRSPWAGKPPGQPMVAVERHGDHVTVYASWNGATGVKAWQVHAGPEPRKLSPVKSFKRSGFETVMALRTSERYVAARALDHEGRVLGKSKVVFV